ncbi:MAG TPA: class I SAM-dependent methyltransferase [Acidobacteriaceae bacterium]|nr:class I SAM-dependent methyltransferase [Acidobacteriaceae bacterium]
MSNNFPNFDRLAKPYRWLEYASFGHVLERCRYHFLSACATVQRALILGDGDGRFTQRLLQTNSFVDIDAIDSSAQMLQALHQRASAVSAATAQRVQTVQADIRKFTPELRDYDLVVSHFFLDCLTCDEIHALIERIQPSLAPNARWLISDFSIPAQGWIRLPARLLVRFLYIVFDWLTQLHIQKLPPYAEVLTQHGFICLEQKTLLRGLLTTELWQAPPRRP